MLEDWELKKSSYLTRAIAISTATNLEIQGGKNPKVELFDPVSHAVRQKSARKSISLQSARNFLELNNQGKIPGWVFSVVDVEAIELASD